MVNLLNYIGDTPYVYLDDIFVKLEYFNPSGSTKDRIAKYIIEKAEKNGKLNRRMEVIESTSGNSGIAFSMVCAIKGYKMNVIMPKGFSKERTYHIKAYNANIIYTPKEENVYGSLKKENELAKNKKYFAVRQFDNEDNITAFERTLGKEILDQHKNRIDAFVAGVGTGGTIIGVSKAIRKRYPNAKFFAVEPYESQVLKGKSPSEHGIEGIGDGFIPDIYLRNRNMIDGIIAIKSKDAINEAKIIASRGFFVGFSSGANMLAAKMLKKNFKNIVTVFPDRGDRYFSMLN
ncbi:MAG: cysteine synthase family protein [Candidatus Woesearchaeota archaeon]|nr:cysteine synthase family protein [Candidatus Woesearchaeota archaeon]